MDEKKIYHLAYVSTACDCLKLEDINSILESSNKNNKCEGITGILVYCNKHFFQILEGDKEQIIELYDKIVVDCRHDNVIKIKEGEIETRNFSEWSMAFKSYNKELKYLDNFNNEQIYTYIHKQIEVSKDDVALKILADFFDLNG